MLNPDLYDFVAQPRVRELAHHFGCLIDPARSAGFASSSCRIGMLLENTHAGAVRYTLDDGDGLPSRWNTLRALHWRYADLIP